MELKYGSICSGIGAPEVAWQRLGWKSQFMSQYDPEWDYKKRGPDFASRVLQHHYPDVPNLGDMCLLTENKIFNESTFDVFVGGTPCQSFSVAGLRKGLGDQRGNLSLEFVRLLMRKRPPWFIWENVPGVLSSGGHAENYQSDAGFSKDFACILSAFTGRDVAATQTLSKAGVIEGTFYSVAWRILDSQYFGVPQRRRRVFVVGYLGADWRPPAAVLFERDSLRRDFTPKRKEGKGTTGNAEASSDANSQWPARVASTLDTQFGDKMGLDNQHSHAGCPLFVPVKATWWDGGSLSATLTRRSHDQYMPDKDNFQAIIQPVNKIDSPKIFIPHGFADNQQNHVSGTLKKNGGDLGGGSESLIVNPQTVVYSFDSLNSNSMKSSNPHSGVHITDVAKCLDTTVLDPSKNQGGNAILQPVAYGIQANIIGRKDENGGNGKGVRSEQAPTLTKTDIHGVCYDTTQITSKTNASNPQPGDPCHPLAVNAHPPLLIIPVIAFSQNQSGDVLTGRNAPNVCYNPMILNDQGGDSINVEKGDTSPTLRAQSHQHEPVVCNTPLAFKVRQGKEGGGKGYLGKVEQAFACSTKSDQYVYAAQTADTITKGANQTTGFVGDNIAHETRGLGETYKIVVRRLTPLECERLQGFPDGYTDIPDMEPGLFTNPANATDSYRYSACGNSMTTYVMEWIGQRIDLVYSVLKELGKA